MYVRFSAMFHKSRGLRTYYRQQQTCPKIVDQAYVQQFDKSKFLSELHSYYLAAYRLINIIEEGFSSAEKSLARQNVFSARTQSIQTSVVRLWIIWMTSYASFFDPLSIKNVGPPARWVAVLAKFTANKPLFFAN